VISLNVEPSSKCANPVKSELSFAMLQCRQPPFLTTDGAQTARFTHEKLSACSTRGCFVHVTRSRDENASKKSCSSYGAE
jgi:hypothetical protein